MQIRIFLLVFFGAMGLTIGTNGLLAQPAEDAAIEQAVRQMVDAYNKKDLLPFAEICDPDVLMIEAGNKFVGWAGFRDNLKMEWDMLSDGFSWNVGKIQVHSVGNEFAWVIHEGSFQGKMKDGTELQESMLESYIFQKKSGAWRLVHSHLSSRPTETLPNNSVSPSLDYFSIGSTKAEVLAIQGNPTGFKETLEEIKWWYGESWVVFKGGRVADLHSSPQNPLTIKMTATNFRSPSRSYFVVGSTVEELLAVQGQPDKTLGLAWYYGNSTVTVYDGKVESYVNKENLKVRKTDEKASSYGKTPKKTSAKELPKKLLPESQTRLLKYATVKTQDISYANTPRMIHRVVLNVTDIPSETQLKTTALHIWENGNKNWNEFTIFMYLPDMNTNGEAFVVAEFRPQGLKEFRFQMLALTGTKWETSAKQKEKLMAETASSLRKQIERETGPVSLTTEMKKKIYRAFVNDPLWAEDDGTEKVVLKLADKYMRRYNLSRTEFAAICAEGAEKGW